MSVSINLPEWLLNSIDLVGNNLWIDPCPAYLGFNLSLFLKVDRCALNHIHLNKGVLFIDLTTSIRRSRSLLNIKFLKLLVPGALVFVSQQEWSLWCLKVRWVIACQKLFSNVGLINFRDATILPKNSTFQIVIRLHISIPPLRQGHLWNNHFLWLYYWLVLFYSKFVIWFFS